MIGRNTPGTIEAFS
ncbi:hypothetical protein YPPY60_3011, partial [Yersinia pestis PY-60]